MPDPRRDFNEVEDKDIIDYIVRGTLAADAAELLAETCKYQKVIADQAERREQSTRAMLRRFTEYAHGWIGEMYSEESDASDAGICGDFRAFFRDLCEDFHLEYPWRKDVSDAVYCIERLCSALEEVVEQAKGSLQEADELYGALDCYQQGDDVDLSNIEYDASQLYSMWEDKIGGYASEYVPDDLD